MLKDSCRCSAACDACKTGPGCAVHLLNDHQGGGLAGWCFAKDQLVQDHLCRAHVQPCDKQSCRPWHAAQAMPAVGARSWLQAATVCKLLHGASKPSCQSLCRACLQVLKERQLVQQDVCHQGPQLPQLLHPVLCHLVSAHAECSGSNVCTACTQLRWACGVKALGVTSQLGCRACTVALAAMHGQAPGAMQQGFRAAPGPAGRLAQDVVDAEPHLHTRQLCPSCHAGGSAAPEMQGRGAQSSVAVTCNCRLADARVHRTMPAPACCT